jgi:hypothetical protein
MCLYIERPGQGSIDREFIRIKARFFKIYFKKFGGLKTSLKFYRTILLDYGI